MINDLFLFLFFIEDGAHIQLVYNKSEVSRNPLTKKINKHFFLDFIAYSIKRFCSGNSWWKRY
jgi:hypothetical protein